MRQHSSSESNSQPKLMGYIERLERLDDEKAEIGAHIRVVKAECSADGYDIKVVNQMLRERKLDPEQRAYFLSLCEVYRANLGMLNGTPLGEEARRRFEKGAKEEARSPDHGNGESNGTGAPAAEAKKEVTAEEAYEQGAQAANGGKKIFDNPYTANDKRRAAWDNGYCAQLGHNGMELPAALRRAEKPKKSKKPDGDGGGE